MVFIIYSEAKPKHMNEVNLEYLHAFFQRKKAHFLTVKGKPNVKKYQNVKFWSDKIRKISKNFLIVREKNKKSEGFHFHAIILFDVQPKPAFFIKGVHMNLRRIGQYVEQRRPVFSRREIAEHPDESDVKQALQENDERLELNMLNRLTSNIQDITRVLKYMSKDLELPIQYHDYVLILSNKSKPLIN